MTEVEWIACISPSPMLEFMQGKISERKLRLFACACCRCVWHLLNDERSREAIVAAELFADGLASVGELRNASCFDNPYATVTDDGAAVACFDPFDLKAATLAADVLLRRHMHSRHPSDFLRDILGNPFCSRFIGPAILRWNDGTVVKLAQSIYDYRAFDRLPILADALEDAGCDNADILAHCRSEGPHVRGCWVVDLLLGKQ